MRARGYIKRENWCYNVERNTYIAISIDRRRRGHSTTNCCSCSTRAEDEEEEERARVSVRPQTASIHIIHTRYAREIRYILLFSYTVTTPVGAVMSSLTPSVQWFSSAHIIIIISVVPINYAVVFVQCIIVISYYICNVYMHIR